MRGIEGKGPWLWASRARNNALKGREFIVRGTRSLTLAWVVCKGPSNQSGNSERARGRRRKAALPEVLTAEATVTAAQVEEPSLFPAP